MGARAETRLTIRQVPGRRQRVPRSASPTTSSEYAKLASLSRLFVACWSPQPGSPVLQRDEACMRETVARRPSMATGVATDGNRLSCPAGGPDSHAPMRCRPRAASPVRPSITLAIWRELQVSGERCGACGERFFESSFPVGSPSRFRRRPDARKSLHFKAFLQSGRTGFEPATARLPARHRKPACREGALGWYGGRKRATYAGLKERRRRRACPQGAQTRPTPRAATPRGAHERQKIDGQIDGHSPPGLMPIIQRTGG